MIATESKNIVFSREIWEQAKLNEKHHAFLEGLENMQREKVRNKKSSRNRQAGTWKHFLELSPDFDKPIENWQSYMK